MEKYEIVERIKSNLEQTLKGELTLFEAEKWLSYYLDHGHDCYISFNQSKEAEK